MIETFTLVIAFVVLAVLAFAASVRLGMLVGLRLDRFIVERASATRPDELETPGFAPSTAPGNVDSDSDGQQEDRGD